MKVLVAITLFIIYVTLSSADVWNTRVENEDEDEDDGVYSWRLGKNESVPATEVIVDPYGKCNCEKGE